MGIETYGSSACNIFFVQVILKVNDITLEAEAKLSQDLKAQKCETIPVELSATPFGWRLFQSHIVGPLPSFLTAPSTWNAAVATPKRKFFGSVKLDSILAGAGANQEGYKAGGAEGTGIGSCGTLVVVNGGASTGPTYEKGSE